VKTEYLAIGYKYINRRPVFAQGFAAAGPTLTFQADKQMASRFSGIAGFASAGLPGRSLARRLVAEAKVCVCQRLSSERSEPRRAGCKLGWLIKKR
jgi:hypothetical protein